MNVAIASLRLHPATTPKVTSLHRRSRRPRQRESHSVDETRLDVADHVVRGQHQQQRIAGILAKALHVPRARWPERGVAPDGFQQDLRVAAMPSLAQLLGHQEAVRVVAHHQRWR